MRPKFLDSPRSYTHTPRTGSLGYRDLHGEKLQDNLSAAKGIFVSAVLGAILWAVLGGLAWLFFVEMTR